MSPEPSKMMDVLKEAVGKVDLKGCTFNPAESHYWTPSYLIRNGESKIDFDLPYADDEESLISGLTVIARARGHLSHDDCVEVALMLAVAANVIREFNKLTADLASDAKKRAEEAEAARIKAEEERGAILEERKERLLTEFLGDAGRIRVSRSKSYQPVIVRARETYPESGVFEVDFEWVNDHDRGRQKQLRHVRSFDLKVGSRYKEVWDDGQDDLNEWDRIKRRVPKLDS